MDTNSEQESPSLGGEVSEAPSFDAIVKRLEGELIGSDGNPDFDLLVELVDLLEKSCRRGGLLENKIALSVIESRYTRIAAAITKVVTHPNAKLTNTQLSAICRRKQTFAYIFNASGYRNMKHFVGLVGEEKDGKYKISLERAAILLCFMGLDDVSDELMELSLRQPPRTLLTLMLGWLNQRAIITQQAEKNRDKLLSSGSLISDVAITDTDIPLIVNAWMYCSYASLDRKHDIKETFNILLCRRMEGAGINPPPVVRRVVERPKMLICHERFTHQHAMYRCYAPYIANLRKYFDLVALADHDMIDEESSKLFDEVIRLESPRPSISDIVHQISAICPDVIYYPSLGMSHWTVMLANLRLAPIQIATMGHPATTRSREIDYVQCMGLAGDPSSVFTERVLMGDNSIAFVGHSQLPEHLPELLPPSEREVRVAINSKVMKLSVQLLDICKKLQASATVPVKFSFFPGERHLFYDGLAAAIRAEMPDARVLPYMGYEAFINEIAACDLALSAFPFGNTNGTVDTCLLGLPTVTMHGQEVPSQTDRAVLESAGYEPWLVCHSDQEYYETALRLINDPELRRSVTGGQTREQIRSRLLDATEEILLDPFAKVFWGVYNHHEEIQNLGNPVLGYKEILRYYQ